jgi:cysteinyl-tRNA synthetase
MLGKGDAGKLQVVEARDLPREAEELVAKREEARKAKNWEEADALRDSLETKGFYIEDGPDGPVVRKTSEAP